MTPAACVASTFVAVTVLLAAPAGCGAVGPGASVDRSPVPVEGFPPWAACGPLRVEARYYLDQATLMGGDLLEDYDLVPVALRLGVVPTSAEAGRLAAVPEEMGIVLLLADGTTLRPVSPEELGVRRRRLERLVREGLEGGLLPPWERAREGFVYFALPAGARGDSLALTIEVPAPGGTRTLDLRGSLVSFEVTIGSERQAVQVGLQLDRHGARVEGARS